MSDLSVSTYVAFIHGIYRVVRSSADWYKRSHFNDRVRQRVEYDVHKLRRHHFLQYDVGLCGYTSLLRIVAKFHEELFSDPDTATGLNKVRRNSWV